MPADTTNETCDLPSAWFAALESALRTGDTKREARAWRELVRLGITVEIDETRASRFWLSRTPRRRSRR